MQVIPAINARDAAEAEKLMCTVAQFLPAGAWIHIDVGDGVYTKETAGVSPLVCGRWLTKHGLKAEIHLMAADYESRLAPWLTAGAQRIIVPVELVRDPAHLLALEKKYTADIMLSCGLDIPLDVMKPFFPTFRFFQILAVPPGVSGQLFDESALQKVILVRAHAPHAIIEVDGGITPGVARRVKDAGADIIVSASYILGSEDPKGAYEELTMI